MCGIAGVLSFDSPERQLDRLRPMTAAMRHRGPDDEGCLTVSADGKLTEVIGKDTPESVRYRLSYAASQSASRESRSVVALGHRRLSILDTSASGHQPMSFGHGRFWIVYNGEVYNFRAIRKELERSGHRFCSDSDTEVVLASYAHWGELCLKRFNGDFAFAIWDNIEKVLFCARDRVGVKPFYYVHMGGRFLFASDIKTLIASGYVSPEPDAQGLYLAMAFGIAPRPITAFKGIRALEQGHWMRISMDGRVDKGAYWDIPVGTQEGSMGEDTAVELLEEQLQRSIERRLVADVPVGTFMSGGIDSTTVSAMAARQHPGIKAFTLGYQNDAPELDEVSQAVATARTSQMEHIVRRVQPEDALDDLHAWIDGYEEPFNHVAANHVVSKLVKDNAVTVVLNGLGGDELFAGYGWYRYHQIPRVFAGLRLAGNISLRYPAKLSRLIGLLTARTSTQLHTVLYQKTPDKDLGELLDPSLQIQCTAADFIDDMYASSVKFSDTVEAISFMDLKNYLGNHHLHRVDQFTMAFSIEGRFPFLDHELIEAAYRIPSKHKIWKGVQKRVLRGVARRYIAPECLSMKKKGFGLPLAQWMAGPLKPLIMESLGKLKKRPEVNGATIDYVHKCYTNGRMPPQRLWHLVALELWFERFIDPGGAVRRLAMVEGE